MLIIGCDFHPGFQQIAIFDNRTGEVQEKRLQHRAEAEQFYRSLAGPEVRVGMEACGHYPWFERLLQELGLELWFGDAAQVRASVVRKQKTDRRDAEHLLDLLRQERFPRIWVPSLGCGMCGSCWCIGTSRCRRGRAPRISCRPWR
jgi:transposase